MKIDKPDYYFKELLKLQYYPISTSTRLIGPSQGEIIDELREEIHRKLGKLYTSIIPSLYPNGDAFIEPHFDFKDSGLKVDKDIVLLSLGTERIYKYLDGTVVDMTHGLIHQVDEDTHWKDGNVHWIEKSDTKLPRIGIIFYNET